MRDLLVPTSPDEHLEWLTGQLGPIADHPHWHRVAQLHVAERAPLGYIATDAEECQNLSMWWGLLDLREGTYAPDRDIVRALYVAHELAHLLTPTPHVTTRAAFVEAFHISERFASYETELAIYGDLPELGDFVPFRPLLARWLTDRGVDISDADTMMQWRDDVIDDPSLLSELPEEAARFAIYSGTRPWAAEYWDRLDRIGWWDAGFAGPATTSFDAATVRARLAAHDLTVDRDRWERTVVDNVIRAYLLCGLNAPALTTLADATAAARDLDGLTLATINTPTRQEIR